MDVWLLVTCECLASSSIFFFRPLRAVRGVVRGGPLWCGAEGSGKGALPPSRHPPDHRQVLQGQECERESWDFLCLAVLSFLVVLVELLLEVTDCELWKFLLERLFYI